MRHQRLNLSNNFRSRAAIAADDVAEGSFGILKRGRTPIVLIGACPIFEWSELEIDVALVAFDEQPRDVQSVGLEQRPVRFDLGFGHAADQMGSHVLRFGRRRIVGVPPDVQIAVLGLDAVDGHDGGKTRNRFVVLEGFDDLFRVFGAQIVDRAARLVLAVGIDEQDLAAPLLRLLVRTPHDQDTGRDAGPEEQIVRQSDHGLDQIVFQKLAADLQFLAAAEQHAVRHHGGHRLGTVQNFSRARLRRAAGIREERKGRRDQDFRCRALATRKPDLNSESQGPSRQRYAERTLDESSSHEPPRNTRAEPSGGTCRS